MTLMSSPRPVAPEPSLWARLRAVLRGLALVVGTAVRLVGSAPMAFASAVTGTPPGWLRRFGRRVADRYRLGYHAAREGDVIDDQHEEAGR